MFWKQNNKSLGSNFERRANRVSSFLTDPHRDGKLTPSFPRDELDDDDACGRLRDRYTGENSRLENASLSDSRAAMDAL